MAHIMSDKYPKLNLIFKIKGNKLLIEKFCKEGWRVKRRYKNDDGDLSHFKYDYMKKTLNSIFKCVYLNIKFYKKLFNFIL